MPHCVTDFCGFDSHMDTILADDAEFGHDLGFNLLDPTDAIWCSHENNMKTIIPHENNIKTVWETTQFSYYFHSFHFIPARYSQ